MINENSKLEIRNLKPVGAVKNFIESFLKIFNKPLIRILLLGALLLVVVFTSLEITKNPNDNKFGLLSYPQDQTVVGEKLPQTNISFSFPKTTKIPDSISVYKIQVPSEGKNRAFFDNVSTSLGATKSAQIKTFGTEKSYAIIQDNFYFVGNLSTGYFSFNGKSAKTLDTTDKDSIKLSSWDYLSLLGLTNNITNQPLVSYYDYAGGEPVVSKNTLLSDAVSLSYSASINSIPIIGLGSTETQLKIMVDKKNKNIVELDFALPAIDTKTSGQYSILSLGDIAKVPAEKFNFLSLIDSGGEKLANYDLADFSSVSFNDVSLVYYITPEAQGLLQPMFVLKGNAVLKDKRSGTITAILPAAKNVVASP